MQESQRKSEFEEANEDPTRSASAEPRPPRKRFSLNRGVPSLSCTFGAAPGSKHKQINYEELAAEYKLVHKADAVGQNAAGVMCDAIFGKSRQQAKGNAKETVEKASEAASNAAAAACQGAQDVADTSASYVEKASDTAVAAAREGAQDAADTSATYMEKARQGAQDVADASAPYVEKAQQGAQDVADASAPYIEKARQGAQDVADASAPYVEKAQQGAQDVADASAPYIEKARQGAKDAADASAPYVEKARQGTKDACDASAPYIEKARQGANDAAEASAPYIEKARQGAKDAADASAPYVEKARQGTKDACDASAPYIEKARQGANDAAEASAPYIEKARQGAKDAADASAPYVEKARQGAKDACDASAPYIEKARQGANDAAEASAPYIEKARQGAQDAADASAPYVEKARQGAKDACDASAPYMEKARKGAQDVADASAPYLEKARQGVQSMADASMPWFQRASEAARQGAQKVAEASAPYLQSASEQAASAASAARTNVESAFNSNQALEVARRGKQKHWDLDEDAAGRSVESPKAGDVAKTDSVTKTDSLKLEEEDEAAPAEAEASEPRAGSAASEKPPEASAVEGALLEDPDAKNWSIPTYMTAWVGVTSNETASGFLTRTVPEKLHLQGSAHGLHTVQAGGRFATMIYYRKGYGGLLILFRIVGTSWPFGVAPGLIALAISLILSFWPALDDIIRSRDDFISHPYAFQLFAYLLGFLMVFRTNFAYQRYWEAIGAMQNMAAKWLDGALMGITFDAGGSNARPLLHGAQAIRPKPFGCSGPTAGGMTTGGLPPQCSQGMTLGDVIQTLQQELRKGMEQQQQRLTKETLDAIEKGLAPVHELIEKVENKATKGIQATLANAKGLSKGPQRRRSPRISATAPNSTADTYYHRGQIDGLYYQGNDNGVYNPIHQKNADDLYYQGTTKAGEQLPLSATTGTQKGSAGQSLAQPVSPGPWGPQDEEFEQEAWTSILGYVPGRDQEPRGAEGDHQTTATGPPPAAQPPPPKAHAATNLATPTRGVLRGLSPLAAGAARAVPAATPVPVKLGDGTDYRKAAPKGSEHEARQTHNNTELIETIRDNHNNSDDYLHAQGPVFDAYPTDEDAAEEPDWSRDSQDEADEEKGDDTTNLDKPGPSYGTRGSERPAEPVGAPPTRPGSREDLTAEETRTERNRRARAEWREWRRQQRRRGLAPGYFYPSGAERWQRRS
ncbi:Suprabasin [Symbiodinium microadriaticum]|uniref:Suprabasin n=1 Tax=Symbiodinium microadriaticum TaxID=2951 RepID=A0A1Q9D1M4_SYMMI|nr:Suprabasin [Symbiodinium microadriaticum]